MSKIAAAGSQVSVISMMSSLVISAAAASRSDLGQRLSVHSAGYRYWYIWARCRFFGFLQSCEYPDASWELRYLGGTAENHQKFCTSPRFYFCLTSFQDSGQHLSVIDDCNDHMLTVWDWQKKSKIAEIKVINFFASFVFSISPYKL